MEYYINVQMYFYSDRHPCGRRRNRGVRFIHSQRRRIYYDRLLGVDLTTWAVKVHQLLGVEVDEEVKQTVRAYGYLGGWWWLYREGRLRLNDDVSVEIGAQMSGDFTPEQRAGVVLALSEARQGGLDDPPNALIRHINGAH